MFLDFTIPEENRGNGTIPANHFDAEIDSPYPRHILKIVGVALLVLGVIGILLTSNPSVLYWVSYTGAIIGGAGMCIGVLLDGLNYIKIRPHLFRMLHLAETSEEYLGLLSTDVGVKYSYCYPDFVRNHLQIGTQAQRIQQSQRDEKGMIVYLVNGVKVEKDISAQFGDFYQYANQTLMAPVLAIISSRYQCHSALPFQVTQKRATSVNQSNATIDLKGRVLEATQLFEITQFGSTITTIKYIKAVISVDLKTGSAVVTWSSPQDDIPKI